MDESLYQQWLSEQVEDLQEALLYNGINGLFEAFQDWLKINYTIEPKNHNQ